MTIFKELAPQVHSLAFSLILRMLMKATTLLPPALGKTEFMEEEGMITSMPAYIMTTLREMRVTIRLMEEKGIITLSQVQEMILFPQEQGLT